MMTSTSGSQAAPPARHDTSPWDSTLAREWGNDLGAEFREKCLDPTITYKDCGGFRECDCGVAPTLPLYGKSVKYGADGPRLHVQELAEGMNPGLLTLRILSEPNRIDTMFFCSGYCCDACSAVMLEIHNLDLVYHPIAISQRLAPGREIHISSPVLDIEKRNLVRVADPTAVEFAMVRPRCFSIGCDSAGPMLWCGGCRTVASYCGKVCFR